MGKEYVYIPVNSQEMSEFAERVADKLKIPKSHILANKVTSGVGKAMYRWIDKCLSQLQPEDTLYIVTHGTGRADAKTVGAERSMGKNVQKKVFINGNETFEGGEWKSYTPEQLAKTLEKEGLPKNFVNLHLCTCGGGYSGKMDPWASRLKDAMKKLYTKVMVTGYCGAFEVSYIGIFVSDGGQRFPFQEKAVVF